jgi:hypothetical protein
MSSHGVVARLVLFLAPLVVIGGLLGISMWRLVSWTRSHPGEPPTPREYFYRMSPFVVLAVLAGVGLYLQGNPVTATLSIVAAAGFVWLLLRYHSKYGERGSQK